MELEPAIAFSFAYETSFKVVISNEHGCQNTRVCVCGGGGGLKPRRRYKALSGRTDNRIEVESPVYL